MNILLIEDNEGDRRIIREAFTAVSGDNGQLYMAETGEAALRFLRKEKEFEGAPCPDLILLDLNLPGLHGSEILKTLKSDPVNKIIPVIVLTSSNSQQDICKSYGLGASCFLNKPMRYGELLNLMKLLYDFWIKEVRYCQA